MRHPPPVERRRGSASRTDTCPSRHPRRASGLRGAGLRAIALALSLIGAAVTPAPATAANVHTADVIVYSGTPGGVIAAYTAARAGASVIVVEPTLHIGGIMSNGLTATDIGDRRTVGGYALDFFKRTEILEGVSIGRWRFQPKHAEQAGLDMLDEAGVTVHYGDAIAEQDAVVKSGARIESFATRSGAVYAAKVFIDASYEGDLLARAGVQHAIGREARSTYGESLAGRRPAHAGFALPRRVLRPLAGSAPTVDVGEADARIQDYNYRICLSSDRANQIPFPKPDGYVASHHHASLAYIRSRPTLTARSVLVFAALPNQKFDVNNNGMFSTALTGRNYDWPDGSQETRDAIAAEHTRHAQGLLYFLRWDTRVPAEVRDEMAGYGLCKDEFTDNANWPRQLYVREARRMIGRHVLTEQWIAEGTQAAESIGLASYRLDAHYVSLWLEGDRVKVEGSIQGAYPYINYSIPYRAITPNATDATNLLVPVAASASHVAWASLRMEPHFMVMGEAAGEAAAMVAAGTSDSVQGVHYPALRARLLSHGAKLTVFPRECPVDRRPVRGPPGRCSGVGEP
jgi:hypothetical protein